jgi:cytochrome oxidase Cu insertion factor (SCO1/SenC/PrrC family)
MTTAFFAALLLLAQAKDRPPQGAGAEPGKPAPAFKLKTQDGKAEVSLDTLKGKPALLVFGSYT